MAAEGYYLLPEGQVTLILSTFGEDDGVRRYAKTS
jgi:hypothetical protein